MKCWVIKNHIQNRQVQVLGLIIHEEVSHSQKPTPNT